MNLVHKYLSNKNQKKALLLTPLIDHPPFLISEQSCKKNLRRILNLSDRDDWNTDFYKIVVQVILASFGKVNKICFNTQFSLERGVKN